MKIHYRQSGGFAGITLGADVDVDDLSEREAAEFRALVHRLPIDQIPPRRPSDIPDLTTHTLTVESDGGIHSVSFDDTTVPPSIQPLLDLLQPRIRRV